MKRLIRQSIYPEIHRSVVKSHERTLKITTSQAHRQVPVTIVNTDGVLDGSNYRELITEVQKVYNAGA